jgi:hypothetical protein
VGFCLKIYLDDFVAKYQGNLCENSDYTFVIFWHIETVRTVINIFYTALLHATIFDLRRRDDKELNLKRVQEYPEHLEKEDGLNEGGFRNRFHWFRDLVVLENKYQNHNKITKYKNIRKNNFLDKKNRSKCISLCSTPFLQL